VTLDPRITSFLADVEMRAAALPPAGTPAQNRAQLDSMGNELFQEVAEGIPEGVVIEDRTLPVGQGGIPVRIYRPDATGSRGLHVLIHGGGWTQGSIYDWISDVQSSERALGAQCIVVTVEYRLAPENPYPAGLDDVVDAVHWIIGHATELGGDPAQISIGGVSAGGNLVAAALLRLRDEGAPLPDFAIYEAGVFDFDTSYDSFDRYGVGFGLESTIMPALTEIYLSDPSQVSDPYVSPVRAQGFNGLPRSHFITAEFDPTRDTSDAFADRLEQAGIPVTRYRGIGHVHQSPVMTKVLPIAREWRAEVISALRGFHMKDGFPIEGDSDEL